MDAGSAADVLEDLGFEGFGGVEFAFLADPAEEFDEDAGGGGGIEWLEEEGFDGEPPAVEGGAGADVGDGFPAAGAVEVAGAGDVDAGAGHDFGIGLEVEGGDGLFGADSLPWDDGTFEGEGFAEQAGGVGDAAGGDGLADEAAGGAFAADFDGGNKNFAEAVFAAAFFEHAAVAGLFVSEAKVFADDDGLDAEAVDEEIGDELFGGPEGDFGGEGENEDLFDAFLGHEVDAAFEGGDELGGAGGGDDFGGWGWKVRTEGFQPFSRAISAARRMRTRCPAWTPSKLPMVRAEGPKS